MKTNSAKKIIVSTLALAMGAGLAGSISGSVAWYQYSTRTTAQLQGVSAGTSRNLRLRIAGSNAWSQDLTTEMINTYLGITGGQNAPSVLKLNPATVKTVNRAKDTLLVTRTEGNNTVPDFRGHPVYQYSDLPNVGPTYGENAEMSFNYIQIPLEFDLVDNDGRKEKDIYLTAAKFNDLSDENHSNITDALRIHFSSSRVEMNDQEQPVTVYNNALLASRSEGTVVGGYLDLNNDGEDDRNGFGATDGNKIIYGGSDYVQTSYISGGGSNINNLVADDSNVYDFGEGAISLGKTKTAANEYLKITLTIWLEGWTALPAPTNENPSATSNLWDLKFSGSDFGIQLRFACEADA